LVATIATAARFAHFHIPMPCKVQLVAVLARFWRKISAPHAVRSHPVDCTCIPRRAPPRTDGNQHAVSTTCRTSGTPFVSNMTNTKSCRVAPRLRQYLAWGAGFWCRHREQRSWMQTLALMWRLDTCHFSARARWKAWRMCLVTTLGG
jgi:hypothetical protein